MKNMRSKKALLLGTILVVGAGSVFIFQSWTSTPSTMAAEQESATGNSVELTLTPEYRVGDKTRYSLAIQSGGQVRFAASGDKALIDQALTSELEATVEEVVLDVKDDRIQSFLRFDSLRISMELNGQLAHDINAAIERDLAGGMLVIRNRSGLVDDIMLLPGANQVSLDTAYALSKSFQFRLPEGPLPSEWSSREEDPHGIYEARYQRMAHADETVAIRRERLRYTQLSMVVEGNMGHNDLESEVSSQTDLSFNRESHRLLTLKSVDRLRVFDANHQPFSTNQQTVQWTFISHENAGESAGKELALEISSRFTDPRGYIKLRDEAEAEQLSSMYKRRLGNDGFEDLTKTMQEALVIPDKDQREKMFTEIFLKARAFVYLKPEELDLIGNQLKALPVDSEIFQLWTSALVNISSPEAQKLLVETTMDMRGRPEHMRTLIPDLGFLKDPEPMVEEALKSLMRDPETNNSASLALATLGSQLAKSDKKDAESRLQLLTAEIVSEFRAASQADEIRHWLDRLGNLSAPSTVPVIEEALQHAAPTVRATAAFALRDMNVEGAEATLLRVLHQDADNEVRLSASEALQSYKPSLSLLDAQEKLLAKEGYERVRIQLLLNIVKAKYWDSARVRSILQNAKDSDSSDQVRNYAESLLTEFQAH